ncbi:MULTISPECIES: hypothetical protein [unclassified Halorubrum]|uniref:hypothetical protein n=1 Tax=unclassified Halorubrum TaxID=2642239 RepID=UPI000B994909|nr:MULTISPECIES: hypothetical protein [unclassified Halorubrum]OYR42899.1 hypothetical protein DJ75_12440 [Halorubrum sp. Eb13]OYR51113.1 hypothetical protein DJ73_14235 [Halorubrum sp. Ea1]
MRRSLSRRRLLAASVPGLLAGCLVESGDGGDGVAEPDAGADGGESESDAETGTDEGTDSDGSTADRSEPDREGTDQVDDDSVPDAVGPDGSGLVVANAEVLDVADEGYETTVDARLTVENRGRFTYGTVEFRADAYATRPNSAERDSAGFAYDTERFPSGNRFGDGVRRFDVSITFRSRETNVPADVDWYEVDAAVRRAEPV